MITQITQIHDETAYNRAYLASAVASAQIPPFGQDFRYARNVMCN